MNIRQYFSVNSSSGTLIGMRVGFARGKWLGKDPYLSKPKI
jgi:hypothetical protein